MLPEICVRVCVCVFVYTDAWKDELTY